MTGSRRVSRYDAEAVGHRISALCHFKTPYQELERTPEVVAVSGVYRGSPGGEESSPGTPGTNLSRTATAVLDRPFGTPQKPTEKNDPLYYLEHIDKGFSGEAKSCLPFSPKKCGQWSAFGQCLNGHRFRKILYCGKPWCELCRDIIHRRKTARCLLRVQQFETMGYWVIRPPWELMPLLRTKKSRARFTSAIIDAFQAIGYRRGLTFKHDFGERSTRYAFHLNILVDGGYLSPEMLDELKRKLRRLIYPRSVIRKWGDKLDIFYEYRQTPAEMMHTLKYCTKATFTDIEWDEPLASNLHGERYSGWWGKWDESPKWELAESDKKLESLVSLEQGKCPICDSPISWNKHPLPSLLIDLENPVDLGNGYGFLPPIRPPPAGRLDISNLTELPDGDYRKHPNAVRRSIEIARERVSFLRDCESCS